MTWTSRWTRGRSAGQRIGPILLSAVLLLVLLLLVGAAGAPLAQYIWATYGPPPRR